MALVDPTIGPIPRVVRALAIPAIAQALLHTAYGFTDYVFIAQLNDTAATAAVSACFGVIVVLFGVSRFVAVGAYTLSAQLTGAKALGRRRRLVVVAMTMSLCFGLMVSATGYFFAHDIAGVLNLGSGYKGAEEQAGQYLQVLMLGFPVMCLLHLVADVFRAMGHTVLPVVLEGVTLLINTLGNGLLVAGWFTGIEMGVSGAALASIVASGLTSTVAIIWLLKAIRKAEEEMEGEDLSLSRSSVRDDIVEITRLGLPASLMPIVYGLVFNWLIRLAGEVGEPAQAGLGAAIRGVEWVSWAVCMGYYVAGSVAVGQCIGACLPERAKKIGWYTTWQSAIVVGIVGLLTAATSSLTIQGVVSDPEARNLGAQYLFWMGIFMFTVPIDVTLEGILIGVGRTTIPMKISVVMNLLRIPIACIVIYGPEGFFQGVLFALGFEPSSMPEPAGMTQSFLGITWAIVLSAAGKAIWAYLAVKNLDFDGICEERQRRLALGDVEQEAAAETT
jgi:putative MATE family efflux protein